MSTLTYLNLSVILKRFSNKLIDGDDQIDSDAEDTVESRDSV